MRNQSALAGSEGEVTDLFVLSDEQILEIAPDAEVASQEDSAPSGESASNGASRNAADAAASVTNHRPPALGHQTADRATGSQPQVAVPLEPPAWLVSQMKDPWGGEEAREFWDGAQQARTEAAAYRAAIASPEDARALKELYPGGVSEARAMAERARLLDEVDRAYFGANGNSPEQMSASRAQLAQRMLQEDPAAFREMVETGIRILQDAAGAPRGGAKSLASAVSDGKASASASSSDGSLVGAQHAAPQLGNASTNEGHVAAYAAFERATNEDLERSVGTAIEHTLAQALPSVEQHNPPGQAGAQRAAPLRERLAASVRADVEKALQGDRQLGEQVAQILSARRFDNESRSQIVRLISERAHQLVPGAAKRVLNEWTQTTLAAHRGRTQRADSASATDVAPASAPARPVGSEQRPARRQDAPAARGEPARPIRARSITASSATNKSSICSAQSLDWPWPVLRPATTHSFPTQQS
jgi:hypothetical protein